MAAELETLYKQPAFVDTGRLVRGKMILPSHGKEFFTSYGKHFFT